MKHVVSGYIFLFGDFFRMSSRDIRKKLLGAVKIVTSHVKERPVSSIFSSILFFHEYFNGNPISDYVAISGV